MDKYVERSLIIVPENRQRKDFDIDQHQELVESIQTHGLINPVTLTPGDGNTWELVAGERRLRAIDDLIEFGQTFRHGDFQVPVGMVPFVAFSELSPLDRAMLELEENIKRKALTWQEQATATAQIAELLELRAKEYGSAGVTAAELYAEVKSANISGDPLDVRQNLVLAKHLDNPVVKGAKSREEAYKALKRDETAKRYAEDAKRIGATLSSTDYVVHHSDCFEWMAGQPDAQFDVILTDPPYGMGADEFGDSGQAVMGAHGYEDTAANLMQIIETLPYELFRLAKPEAHLYLFCDIDWFPQWKGELRLAGWNVFRTPLIWYKPQAFRAPWPEHGPQRKYETLIYARKGDRRVTKLYPDVIECNPDVNMGHAAQKPVALFENLLRRSVQPGDKIFDPFCGTGPIFSAAKAVACRATGCELDDKFYGMALSRIEKLTKGP